jgi:O-antigen ligase
MDHPFFGIGANHFIADVSSQSTVEGAQLIPVHNSVMMFIVELGIVGAIALILPLCYVFFRSFAQVRSGSHYAISLVSILPAVLVMFLSDYSMTSNSKFVLLIFVLAFLYGQCRLRENHPALRIKNTKRLYISSSVLTVVIIIISFLVVFVLKV